jgi:hypothetical protein
LGELIESFHMEVAKYATLAEISFPLNGNGRGPNHMGQWLSRVDVRSGNAAVQVVHKNDAGRSGGGGTLGWPFILALLALITFRRVARLEGMA